MKAIILAAGQGKRMQSQTPKVLHPILGKPLLKYVTDACTEAGINEIEVIVSPTNIDAIQSALPGNITFTVQEEARGTGHAVMAAKNNIKPDEDVLILYGDMPLITSDFIKTLMEFYETARADGIVTALHMPGSSDFGRVFASSNDMLARIVEHRDLTPNDPHTDLINVGVYLFKGEALLYGLDKITDKNNQHEYYLTDVPGVLRAMNYKVKIFRSFEKTLFAGINNQMQLADAAQIMRGRINTRHMENGVRMLDPTTTYIEDTVIIEAEAVIYPGVVLEGKCQIGAEATVGPHTRMVNTILGAQSTAQYSVLLDSIIGKHSEIGPFTHLRPGSVIGDHSKAGAFVEMKNASIGDNTWASHLAYIGDAVIGNHVNFGCGSIIVNFDGINKHQTIIKDHVFVGCNTNLVAPITIDENAFIAAGSTITEDVPASALAIARERQTNKPEWRRKE
jgi:bifunctional UDP-N-acetylglucosamine pyrophosphorylase/glucosamine-1-phosphate N-acetyltransferase